MPETIRVNFGDIMQAVQDKLLADAVIADAKLVTWATEDPESVQQFSGPHDILLIARSGTHGPYDGGAWDLRVKRYLDIFVRSQAVGNAGGGMKKWIKDAFVLGDKVLNSVGKDEFLPEDADGNLLTVEPIKLAGDVPPSKRNSAKSYGDWVCTLEVIYYPKVTPAS